MTPTVVIRENSPTSIALSARDVRDLTHVRRMLIEAVCSVEGDENSTAAIEVSRVRLAALRGYLSEQGCGERRAARRLLLMALLELEDEDDARRFVVAHPALSVLTLGK